MERIEEIFKNILIDVRKFTNLKTAVNENCETLKDKENLKEYIEAISLNSCIAESCYKKYGFNNASDMQSFVYTYMWNNPEINLI